MTYTSPQAIERRMAALTRFQHELILDLIERRKERELTQEEVADRMGVTQSAVSQFERYDANPKLSTVLRYANAVGALIDHEVHLDEGTSDDDWIQTVATGAIQSAGMGAPFKVQAGQKTSGSGFGSRVDFAPAS